MLSLATAWLEGEKSPDLGLTEPKSSIYLVKSHEVGPSPRQGEGGKGEEEKEGEEEKRRCLVTACHSLMTQFHPTVLTVVH